MVGPYAANHAFSCSRLAPVLKLSPLHETVLKNMGGKLCVWCRPLAAAARTKVDKSRTAHSTDCQAACTPSRSLLCRVHNSKTTRQQNVQQNIDIIPPPQLRVRYTPLDIACSRSHLNKHSPVSATMTPVLKPQENVGRENIAWILLVKMGTAIEPNHRLVRLPQNSDLRRLRCNQKRNKYATCRQKQWLKWFCEAGGSSDEARLEQTPYPFQPH